jgi:hypothetical protein
MPMAELWTWTLLVSGSEGTADVNVHSSSAAVVAAGAAAGAEGLERSSREGCCPPDACETFLDPEGVFDRDPAETRAAKGSTGAAFCCDCCCCC